MIPKWLFSFQHTSFQSLFTRVSGCPSEPINQFVYSFLVWYTSMLIMVHSLHNFNLLWCYHLISHVPFAACLKSYPAFLFFYFCYLNRLEINNVTYSLNFMLVLNWFPKTHFQKQNCKNPLKLKCQHQDCCYKSPLKILLAANKEVFFTPDSKCSVLLFVLNKRLLIPNLLTLIKN